MINLNLSCYFQQQILGSSKNCSLNNKNAKIYGSTTQQLSGGPRLKSQIIASDFQLQLCCEKTQLNTRLFYRKLVQPNATFGSGKNSH